MASRPSPTGWHVEIDHPNGQTHSPRVTGTPSRQPTANALPTVEIPTSKNRKWIHPDFEGADMRVWVDGNRQPIDQLQDVTLAEDSVTLKGIGGLGLRNRLDVEINQSTVGGFVAAMLSFYTDYEPEVDFVPENRTTDVPLATLSSQADWARACPYVADPEQPLTTDGDDLVVQQVCYPKDAIIDSITSGADARIVLGTRYNSNRAAYLDGPGDRVRFRFTPESDIPADSVGIAVRDQAEGYSNVRYSWEDTTIDEQHNQANDFQWRFMGQSRAYAPGSGYSSAVDRPLKTGTTYTFDVEAIGDGAEYQLDCVAVFDRRFIGGLDFPPADGTHDGGVLPGPQRYPTNWRVPVDLPAPVRAVDGARVEVEGRVGPDPIYVSNTQGRGFAFGDGGTVRDDDFTEPGPGLTLEVGMGRHGGDAATLSGNWQPHRVQSIDADVDLVDTPLVVGRSFDGQAVDVLSQLASETDSLFEFRRDQDGTGRVVWTQPGREPVPDARTPSVSNYEVSKSISGRVDHAIVYGGSRQVRGERIGADPGTAVQLSNERVQQGSVSVTNARSGEQYRSGTDYDVDHDNGTVTVQGSGAIEDGAALAVDYRYQTYGEYSTDVEGPAETTVQDIAGIKSGYSANQAARIIVEEARRPREEGTLTIPSRETGFSLVEHLQPGALPLGPGGQTSAVSAAAFSDLQIRSITTEPGKTTLRLGSRRSVSEIVSDITQRVGNVSRET